MIKEYCDKCSKEIAVSTFGIQPGEDVERWSTTRITIKVTRGPDKDHGPQPGEDFDWTVDVLCPDCAKKWRFDE